MNDEYYEELGRRLCAAALSYRMGNNSIDYTLKNHVRNGEELGEYWKQLAREVSQAMVNRPSVGT